MLNVETSPSELHLHKLSAKIKGLFRRNVSSSDRNDISDYLNAARNELKGYEVEINKLKATILSLENRRDLLKYKMDRYRSLLSPIHRLPTEVLENIFKHDARAVQVRARVVPKIVSLSMVCGRWREVICSTPSLWANIDLDVERLDNYASTDDDITHLTYVLQLFLARSRSAPLNLDLFIPSSEPVHRTTKLLDVLAPSMNRWRVICLNASTEIFEHPAFQLLPQRLPSLQHVTLVSPSEHYINLFNKCPSLTSLELDFCQETPYRFEREWPGIKTLDISLNPSSSTAFVSSFLKVCPNMERLTVWTSATRPELESLIVLPRLKSLTCNGPHILSLFQYLSLPNMSTMTLDIDDGEWDVQSFAEFLSRSSCNITHLTLEPPYSSTDYAPVLSFLRLLPTVQELHLDVRANNGALFGTFLDQLFVGQLSSPLLPHLTDLTLIINERCFKEGPLVRAVKSRWLPDLQDPSEAGVTCLRSLKLEVMGDKFAPTLEPLLYLRDAGLRVDVFLIDYGDYLYR
ncbi:hypothetical protein E1B28_008278 [Marasmius oreades]|uniref:F-box domain-containing protein n=1 Tax=Marasmius oreades TaxID=181124 RepID=A0A9P7URK9_9AGAR|nr:uncharacterized protein E1B28_008278 [Marasmius oreades]KAG7091877.1 hypothetical protein E1B28_008278 [Marasmius oreades]